MGRDTAYWYRRGRGVPVGEGGVALVTAASIAIHRILNAPISTRCVIAANEGAMRLKINLDQDDLMLGTTALICALVSIAVILIDH